jgi:hypothetical protein
VPKLNLEAPTPPVTELSLPEPGSDRAATSVKTPPARKANCISRRVTKSTRGPSDKFKRERQRLHRMTIAISVIRIRYIMEHTDVDFGSVCCMDSRMSARLSWPEPIPSTSRPTLGTHPRRKLVLGILRRLLPCPGQAAARSAVPPIRDPGSLTSIRTRMLALCLAPQKTGAPDLRRTTPPRRRVAPCPGHVWLGRWPKHASEQLLRLPSAGRKSLDRLGRNDDQRRVDFLGRVAENKKRYWEEAR